MASTRHHLLAFPWKPRPHHRGISSPGRSDAASQPQHPGVSLCVHLSATRGWGQRARLGRSGLRWAGPWRGSACCAAPEGRPPESRSDPALLRVLQASPLAKVSHEGWEWTARLRSERGRAVTQQAWEFGKGGGPGRSVLPRCQEVVVQVTILDLAFCCGGRISPGEEEVAPRIPG